jgi:hypothetical protein
VIDVMIRQSDDGYEPQCHPRRRRKIMALISLKVRAGIAALTFAAAVAPLPAMADAFSHRQTP